MDAADLIFFGLWAFTIALIGGLTGLVLGNLRLPAVLLLTSTPAVGAGTNIAISAIAAATALIVHFRSRNRKIDWQLFYWMAPPSAVGALIGGYFSSQVPNKLLLGFIALVLLFSGIDLLRHHSQVEVSQRQDIDTEKNFKQIIGVGFLIGLLGGIVGLILGALRMPALMRYTSTNTYRLVTTNLLTGVLVGTIGALSHIPNASPDLRIILVGGVASIPGAILGARLTGKLSEQQLIKAIGVALIITSLTITLEIAGIFK